MSGLPDPPAGANIGSNAMVPDKDGTVLMAQMGARRIVRVDAQHHIKPFLSDLAQEDFWLTDYEFALLSDECDRSGARWISDHLHRQHNMGLAVPETWRGPEVAPAMWRVLVKNRGNGRCTTHVSTPRSMAPKA